MGTFFDLRPKLGRAVLLAAIVGGLALPTVAAAETVTETHVPFATVVTNICTGEAVAIQGYEHFKTTLKASGLIQLEHNWQDAKGTSLAARYVANNAQSQTLNDIPPGAVVNTEFMLHLIRQKEDGTLFPDDDFMLKTQVQFVVNANGIVTVEDVDFSSECR